MEFTEHSCPLLFCITHLWCDDPKRLEIFWNSSRAWQIFVFEIAWKLTFFRSWIENSRNFILIEVGEDSQAALKMQKFIPNNLHITNCRENSPLHYALKSRHSWLKEFSAYLLQFATWACLIWQRRNKNHQQKFPESFSKNKNGNQDKLALKFVKEVNKNWLVFKNFCKFCENKIRLFMKFLLLSWTWD